MFFFRTSVLCRILFTTISESDSRYIKMLGLLFMLILRLFRKVYSSLQLRLAII